MNTPGLALPKGAGHNMPVKKYGSATNSHFIFKVVEDTPVHDQLLENTKENYFPASCFEMSTLGQIMRHSVEEHPSRRKPFRMLLHD